MSRAMSQFPPIRDDFTLLYLRADMNSRCAQDDAEDDVRNVTEQKLDVL